MLPELLVCSEFSHEPPEFSNGIPDTGLLPLLLDAPPVVVNWMGPDVDGVQEGPLEDPLAAATATDAANARPLM